MRNGSLLHYLRNPNNRLSIHALVDTCAQVELVVLNLSKVRDREKRARLKTCPVDFHLLVSG